MGGWVDMDDARAARSSGRCWLTALNQQSSYVACATWPVQRSCISLPFSVSIKAGRDVNLTVYQHQPTSSSSAISETTIRRLFREEMAGLSHGLVNSETFTSGLANNESFARNLGSNATLVNRVRQPHRALVHQGGREGGGT